MSPQSHRTVRGASRPPGVALASVALCLLLAFVPDARALSAVDESLGSAASALSGRVDWLVSFAALLLLPLIGAWIIIQATRRDRDTVNRLGLLLDGAGIGFVIVDLAEARIRFASRSIQSILTHPLEGQGFALMFQGAVPRLDERERAQQARVSSPGGVQRDVEINCGPTRWRGRAAMIVIIRDVSERLRADKERRIMINAMAHMSEAVVITDNRFRVVTLNRAFNRLLGHSAADLRGSVPLRWLGLAGAEQLRRRQALETLRESGHWQGEVLAHRKDGSALALRVSVAAVEDADGSVSHFVCLFADNAQAQERERKLRHQANHDVLTELPNRIALEDRAQRSLEQARREGTSVALMFVDLDGFKAVNDTYGHAAGDEVLRVMSQRLRAAVRSVDFVARVGGDEFTVLLDHAPSVEHVSLIAEKLLQRATEPIPCLGRMVTLSSSIGVSFYPQDAADFDGLVANADLAMYSAKRQGRNAFQLYSRQIAGHARQRDELASALTQAVEAGCLGLEYQPIVDMTHRQLLGLRALVRWNHPTRGAISPAVFVPLAEEIGLIDAISDWVLLSTCRQAASWRSRGLGEWPVAIRLSPRDYCHTRIVERVMAALDTARWPARSLLLEAGEDTIVQRTPELDKTLAKLSELGTQLVINGFGGGLLSFGHLQGLPRATLKIDRGLVHQLPHQVEALATIRGLVAMARSLGAGLVADGVETRDQHEALLDEGCERAIGYFYGAPMPALDIEMLLERELRLRRGNRPGGGEAGRDGGRGGGRGGQAVRRTERFNKTDHAGRSRVPAPAATSVFTTDP